MNTPYLVRILIWMFGRPPKWMITGIDTLASRHTFKLRYNVTAPEPPAPAPLTSKPSANEPASPECLSADPSTTSESPPEVPAIVSAQSPTESSTTPAGAGEPSEAESPIVEPSRPDASTASPTEPATVAEPAPGPSEESLPKIKTVYPSNIALDTTNDWVGGSPDPSYIKDQGEASADITVFKVKDGSEPVFDGKFGLKHHKIQVNSLPLIAAIEPILGKIDFLINPTKPVIFEEPFRPLYHCHDEIVGLPSALGEEHEAYAAAVEFAKIVKDALQATIKEVADLKSKGLITFSLAWAIFSKHELAFTSDDYHNLILRIKDTTWTASSMTVHCQNILFRFGDYYWSDLDYAVPYFAGVREIDELACYPLQFESDTSVRKKIAARSKRCLDFQGVSLAYYSGFALKPAGDGTVSKPSVDGRILIDTHEYVRRFKKEDKRQYQGYEKVLVDSASSRTTTDAVNTLDTPPSSPVLSSLELAEEDRHGPDMRLTDLAMKKNKEMMLAMPEDIYLCISPWVYGFSLVTDEFHTFSVDRIKPIEWDDHSYDNLVYDEGQKDLVLSLIENHEFQSPETYQRCNIIERKSHGLRILLSGPPGTGKSLFVEALAERTRRPLLNIPPSDLGTTGSVFTTNLRFYLELATSWNAIILLDEAETFLGPRIGDSGRIEAVAVFLRELESFGGIICLTTSHENKIYRDNLSRVNMHLQFRPLRPETRLQLWKQVLQDDKESRLSHELTEKDFSDLAEWPIDGRDIRQVGKMVQSWCKRRNYTLTMDRLKSGIRAMVPESKMRAESSYMNIYS